MSIEDYFILDYCGIPLVKKPSRFRRQQELDIRAAITEREQLGRPLTKKEMKKYIIKNDKK